VAEAVFDPEERHNNGTISGLSWRLSLQRTIPAVSNRKLQQKGFYRKFVAVAFVVCHACAQMVIPEKSHTIPPNTPVITNST